jgi:hypothetical protein
MTPGRPPARYSGPATGRPGTGRPVHRHPGRHPILCYRLRLAGLRGRQAAGIRVTGIMMIMRHCQSPAGDPAGSGPGRVRAAGPRDAGRPATAAAGAGGARAGAICGRAAIPWLGGSPCGPGPVRVAAPSRPGARRPAGHGGRAAPALPVPAESRAPPPGRDSSSASNSAAEASEFTALRLRQLPEFQVLTIVVWHCSHAPG